MQGKNDYFCWKIIRVMETTKKRTIVYDNEELTQRLILFFRHLRDLEKVVRTRGIEYGDEDYKYTCLSRVNLDRRIRTLEKYLWLTTITLIISAAMIGILLARMTQ
jgi:hypothetical protein